MIAWIGVGTTRGVPKPIVDRLAREIQRAVAQPEVNDQLRKLGGFPKSSTPEEATTRVTAEVHRWKTVAEKAGIAKR
jgi:tripartite-type tricarboxylate transporter receptor subunit TctC